MFKDLVKANRSYRGFDESRTISREELVEFVDCARLTPSSINAQPFKYVLVYEKEEVAKVQAITKWAAALPDVTLPHAGKCPTAFIAICQDTVWGGDSMARYQKDVGIVAQTMLLAAVSEGLGGCMIGNYSAKAVTEALNLPETLMPMLLVAFGKPDETVVLTEVGADGKTGYSRDENDVHSVPKRALADIIV